MQRNSKPLTWRPRGLSDSLDASQASTGSMSILQDLIPDPSTQGLYQCRPAALQLGNINGQGPFSSGFSSGFQFAPTNADLGTISVFRVVGDFVYGMAASLTAFPGQDLPFAFNLLTNTRITVGGTINATTTPATQPLTGNWTPPQMDVVGPKALVAHPGFSGAGGNWAGYFDISIPNAPVWHATNLGGALSFAFAPTGVAQFFNRAYWIYNLPAQPAVIFSDVLNPFNATSANQILTFGDNVPLTTIAGLPLSNQLGGIIQCLMLFKNVTNIYQITGDAALATTNPLSVNTLNVATGTLAPNSLAPTPKGLAFISPEGLRIIDFNANVSNPMGEDGSGIAIPFQYAFIPSRISSAANGEVYRVTVQNTRQINNPVQEYWYDLTRNTWSGPHSCTHTHARPYKNTFIITPTFSVATLWQSDYFQTQNSSFIENGQQMTWKMQTTLLPDIDEMVNVCITESTLDLCFPIGLNNITVLALDQDGSVINQVTLASQGGSVPPSPTPTPYNTLWGQFLWGQALWGSGTTGGGGGSGSILPPLRPYILPWSVPIVWSRGSINISGASAQGLDIGALHLRYQVLRQLTSILAAA